MDDVVAFALQLFADRLYAFFIKTTFQRHWLNNHVFSNQTLIVSAFRVAHDINAKPGLFKADKELTLRAVAGVRKA